MSSYQQVQVTNESVESQSYHTPSETGVPFGYVPRSGYYRSTYGGGDPDRQKKIVYAIAGFFGFIIIVHLMFSGGASQNQEKVSVVQAPAGSNAEIQQEYQPRGDPYSSQSVTESQEATTAITTTSPAIATTTTQPATTTGEIMQETEVIEEPSTDQVESGCESTILLIRDCETSSVHKNDGYAHTHCNYVGFQRSMELANIFGKNVGTFDRRLDTQTDMTPATGNVKTSSSNPQGSDPDGTDGLSKKERAEVLAEDLAVAEIMEVAEEKAILSMIETKWPEPSYLYALDPTSASGTNVHDYRGMETLNPLAHRYNLAINVDYGEADLEALGSHLIEKLQSGETCGKVTVVVLPAKDIATLAEKLKCDGCPEKYNVECHDDVWELKYVFDPDLSNFILGEDPPTSKPLTNGDDLWEVWGTVVKMGFDPLRVSGYVGDYHPHGVKKGGRWKPH